MTTTIRELGRTAMADFEVELQGLNLVCEDVDATVEFYRLLGVPIPEENVWRTDSGAHHVTGVPTGSSGAELDFDSRELACVYNEGHRDAPAPGAAVIGFGVATRDAVDELYRRLTEAGHAGRQPPFDAFWGARYAIVADPDGRDVGLMSPRDPDRHSEGPSL
jgi:uncharacterized glyoxalase superfamily protein PhnB